MRPALPIELQEKDALDREHALLFPFEGREDGLEHRVDALAKVFFRRPEPVRVPVTAFAENQDTFRIQGNVETPAQILFAFLHENREYFALRGPHAIEFCAIFRKSAQPRRPSAAARGVSVPSSNLGVLMTGRRGRHASEKCFSLQTNRTLDPLARSLRSLCHELAVLGASRASAVHGFRESRPC